MLVLFLFLLALEFLGLILMLLDCKVFRERLDLKVLRELKELLVLKVLKVFRES